jgi:hypothetical protein
MRATVLFLLLLTSVHAPGIAFAQSPNYGAPQRRVRASPGAQSAEASVKQSTEALANGRKLVEKDLQVLAELRIADRALTDPMQPSVAIQEALDHVDKAKSLGPDFFVNQGVIKMANVLDDARRSPSNADFGRMRMLLLRECIAPAARVVGKHVTALQEETLAWIQVQELVAAHLRQLTELATVALRASDLDPTTQR